MMLTRMRWSLLFVLALLGCAPGVAAAEGGSRPPEPGCRRVPLDPRPVWAFHGRWSEDGESLVLADVGAGVLRLYDRDGRPARTVARPGPGALEFNRPSAIQPLPGGSLLSDGTRFLWLDEELAPSRSYDLAAVPVAPGGTVRGLFEWAAADGRTYGIGDVLLPDGSWRSGFLSMPLEDPTAYRLVRELPLRAREEFDHYLMGDPHVATLGGRGYFLAMAAPPRILEVGDGAAPRRLESFPDGFDRLPALPLHGGLKSAEIRYRAYESARLPVGLFGRAGRLYVLTREPAAAGGAGGTRWSVTRIDPRADRVEGTVVLPTPATHLTLIPGPKRWAVLEKGRVERYGEQPIPSLLLIPSEWIEGGASPLAPGGSKEGRCEGP
jgi:hypothetical protein